MRNTDLLFITLILTLTFGCGPAGKDHDHEQGHDHGHSHGEAVMENEAIKSLKLNTDSIVAVIDHLRSDIEKTSETIQQVEIKTESLREKIKQKWSKIHYYLKDDHLIRIKTYPYDAITKRTEEFYFSNDHLILAVVEDDGSGGGSEDKNELDKLYYYHNGEAISEQKNNDEQEFNIKNSDAEELMQEAMNTWISIEIICANNIYTPIGLR